MADTAYLAILYLCNEKCEFCPCSKDEKKEGLITPFEEIKEVVDIFIEKGIKEIVISGGEPTLHPQLINILNYIQKHNMKIVLLSNGEMFASEKFLNRFATTVNMSELTVITTLHSHIESKHEAANRTINSFARTVQGLLNLCTLQSKIIIKHCITKQNYNQLKEFYKYCNMVFPETVSIQLCGIDYCNISKDRLEQEMLSFVELKPYLEDMFDTYIHDQNKGSKRVLYAINIPLCSADVYYWGYKHLIKRSFLQPYQAYKDPKRGFIEDIGNNVSTDSDSCRGCKVIDLCSGTYKTAFLAFGDKIVKPYI